MLDRHAELNKEARGEECGGCIPPSAIFKHVVDEYIFSIILNFFDNDKPYALSTHYRKCTNKCIMLGETLRISGKKIKQNSPENR